MEQIQQLNRIEIIGIVGYRRTTEVANKKLTRMSVATSIVYTRDDMPVIETTWHAVDIWHTDGMPDLSGVDKGARVHIIGRLRQQQYTGHDGVDRISSSIIASSVEICDINQTLAPEISK